MDKYPIPDKIAQFASFFNHYGYKLYIVGGAVRDYLLGIENSDYDFCTDALPGQIISMFNTVIPTGIKHGTVTVLFRGESYEVTTFRTEGAYTDLRHPDNVTFVTNLEEDLSRRDFTINAFAADCMNGKIIDLFEGKKDLENKIVKAIGIPQERFEEDALRMMRLARFCSRLGFTAEEKTMQAAKELSANLSHVSKERIYDELSKILMSSKPSIGLSILEECGMLEVVLPELQACKNVEQDKVGSSDLLTHIYNAVDAAAYHKYDYVVRLACLLHDIAKPEVMTENEDGHISFYGHEIKGAEMSRAILKRLKCSNQLIEDINILISNHMVKYESNWSDGAIKRFINRVGSKNIDHLFELQWCDQIASEGKARVEEYDEFISRIKDLEVEPLNLKELSITGEDLAEIGIPKTKVMGQILEQLLDMVLDNPELNRKYTLLEYASQIYKRLKS